MKWRAAVLALAFVACTEPAAAQSPFQPLPPGQITTDTATNSQTTSTSATPGGLSSGEQVLVFVGAGGLLALIAWVILRDARSRAPERGGLGSSGGRKTAPPRELKHERDRARAKRARQARKKNR